jgi:glycosyltransferase involved in cell wall biosynthesis
MSQLQYVIITPVKDEEKFIARTLNSVVNQTALPLKWIIVDDGSEDHTAEIVRQYCDKYNYIELLQRKRDGARNTGYAEAVAFNYGYNTLKDIEYDLIVKLDADVAFLPDYFERIIAHFEKNKDIGIGSGIYYEYRGGEWLRIDMPKYHSAGASKVYRKKCFNEIGGIVNSPGWDSVDEIKAMFRGWKTTHFEDLKFKHLKNEGTGMGYIFTHRLHGEICYKTGVSLPFLILKVIHRSLIGKPFFLGGLMLAFGYGQSLVGKQKRLVTKNEHTFYKRMLNKRIISAIKRGKS